MKTPATTQKLRGGYYTPEPIAQFLADWAITNSSVKVLEPSCGDGNIAEAAAISLLKHQINTKEPIVNLYTVELDATEAQKTARRISRYGTPRSNTIIDDFFGYCHNLLLQNQKFDVVLGNPPFIRYQHFQEEYRTIAFQIMRIAGLNPTKLTNSWVPFLVAATLLLEDRGGRIGMVIPAELLQVNYAAELRKFLSDQYSRITIFSFRKLVFSGIQQEVVLFLGEKNGNERTGIRVIELDNIDDLSKHEHTEFIHTELRNMDHSKDKWTQYFLDQKEIDLLRVLRAEKNLTLSGEVIDVDVGIVTGINDFFILTNDEVISHNLMDFVRPIVTRSNHLRGLRFDDIDLKRNIDQGFSCWMLDIPKKSYQSLPPAVKSYIASGESKGYNAGYKCRIRDEWYVVPSVWTPDAFMLRQIHHHPKIVLNSTEATSTDTIHRVRFLGNHSPEALTASFFNSLTFAFTEVTGRSYGGGVLELEPNEAERIPIPLINIDKLDLEKIHGLASGGKIQEALDETDKILLIHGQGFSLKEVEALRGIWSKLRNRRTNRRHTKPKKPLTHA